jgi:hypothetical protein
MVDPSSDSLVNSDENIRNAVIATHVFALSFFFYLLPKSTRDGSSKSCPFPLVSVLLITHF